MASSRMKKRMLFVDDEASIRYTLPAILENEGFHVSVASSVAEALQAIQSDQFDILLADLNIGQPGDGFTVVGAMRRIQPAAATFILTGYPDFESALLAIRNQVDDYITKPADIKKLVEVLKNKSARPHEHRTLPVKRISALIRENRDEIVKLWYSRLSAHPELSRATVDRTQRVDHIPNFLLEIAESIEARSASLTEVSLNAAREHGTARRDQGYTIPMLLIEASILERTIAELLQDNLLAIDISTLIPDMREMSEAINRGVEASVRAFLEKAPEPKAA